MNAPIPTQALSQTAPITSPDDLALTWGWVNPPSHILALAGLTLRSRNTQAGQLLVDLGYIDNARRDQLLEEMEAAQTSSKILDYFSSQEPSRVRPFVNRILALQGQLPFYDQFSRMEAHELMVDAKVFERCQSINAIVMNIDGQQPVIVFSSIENLVAFRTKGRAEAERDPILAKFRSMAPPDSVLLHAMGEKGLIDAQLMSLAGAGGAELNRVSRTWSIRSIDKPDAIAQQASALIDYGISVGASDIAFIPVSNGLVEVYVRKYGALLPPLQSSTNRTDGAKVVLSSDVANRLINLMEQKAGANKDRGQLRVPDDGGFHYISDNREAELRLSEIPLHHHNQVTQQRSVSLRISHRSEDAEIRTLEQLKIPPLAIEHLVDTMLMPQGGLTVSGAMNQGKTATLLGALKFHISHFGYTKKRVTIEDPIEQVIDGATQLQLPPHLSYEEAFERTMRALKRHDVNVLFQNEIRDQQSAEFASRFASSGHLLLATVHANSTIAAVEGIAEMINDKLLSQYLDSQALVMNQRLVGKVCKCGDHDATPTPEEERRFLKSLKMSGVTDFELPKRFARRNPDGCKECYLGYCDQLPIVEVMPFTADTKEAWHTWFRTRDLAARRYLRSSEARPVTLFESAMGYVNGGDVDLNDVLFLGV